MALPSIRRPAASAAASPDVCLVTLMTVGRAPLFGELVQGRLRPSAFGEIVEREWLRLGFERSDVEVQAPVLLPDRVHGTLRFPRGEPAHPFGLRALVACYKATCAVLINDLRGTPGAAVWQCGYVERRVS